MTVWSLPTVAACLALCAALFRWVIQPAFLSPLAKISPIHWSARISCIWIVHKRVLQKETLAVHDAHARLGPIIRLAPNEVSVNSLEGLRTIYGGGFPKNDWYANVFSNYGVQPMFAMADNDVHGRRKKALGNVYAKSTLLSSPAFASITKTLVQDRLMARLHHFAKTEETVEFYDVLFALTMDYVTAYLFGLKACGDLVRQPELASKYAKAYKTRVKYVWLPQELPRLTRWMGKHGLLSWLLPPVAADHSLNWDSEAWVLEMQEEAEATVQQAEKQSKKGEAGNWPTVYAQLRNNLLAEQRSSPASKVVPPAQILEHQKLELASEMVDHVFAGFDTGSIVLLYLAWELSKPENVVWQSKLQSELAHVPGTSTLRDIDSLPLLHAVIMETLRLHAPVSGNSVRVTPGGSPSSFEMPGQPAIALPPDVRIHAQAWSLHRNPSVFPGPQSWKPDRWLDSSAEQLQDMNRWFWAFGSGSRKCAGNNFGMLELKAVAFSIWREFRTELIDGSGMVHNGGFLGGPIGHDGTYLTLKLKTVDSEL